MIHKHWELFAYNSTLGVRGVGASKEEAFEQAAVALTAVVTDPETPHPYHQVAITCEAPNDELLLVDWLNALVFEMTTRQLRFGRFEVHLANHVLQGRAWGEQADVGRHQPRGEVKRATLADLQVEQEPDGAWVAQCVVDV